MKGIHALVLAVLWLLPSTMGWADYHMGETEKVPIGRLITNLQKWAKDYSNEVEPCYSLARVHSMAYALELHEFEVRKGTFAPAPGYPPCASFPPRGIAKDQESKKRKEWQDHLKQAIGFYRRALQIDGRHFPSQLGLAWCLDQAGYQEAAVDSYRKALDLAWSKEEHSGGLMAGGCETEEVASYLLKLLDPQKDAEEIKKIEGYCKNSVQSARRLFSQLRKPPELRLESLQPPEMTQNC
ncbi:MAG: hypothetical protein HY360_17755 [Verrucomicrobia bacterium]|nr:hypothetical protein [Verrucomicrobiota bacterium]